MPVFKDTKTAEEIFGELWRKMINETDFGKKLKEQEISILYVVNDPDTVMYIDEKGPVFGEEAKVKTAVVTMTLSGDTVHKFWLKKLDVPKAMAFRQIKTKGPVNKVLQLIPLLKPGHELYPSYCKKYNLPMD